jgi:hypothetical protein
MEDGPMIARFLIFMGPLVFTYLGSLTITGDEPGASFLLAAGLLGLVLALMAGIWSDAEAEQATFERDRTRRWVARQRATRQHVF